MKIFLVILVAFFILLIPDVGHCADAKVLAPSEMLLGEWRTATDSFEPHPELTKGRMFFSKVDPKTGTGIYAVLFESGNIRPHLYRIVEENPGKQTIMILPLIDGKKETDKMRFAFLDGGKRAKVFVRVERMKVDVTSPQLHVSPTIPPEVMAKIEAVKKQQQSAKQPRAASK